MNQTKMDKAKDFGFTHAPSGFIIRQEKTTASSSKHVLCLLLLVLEIDFEYIYQH